MCFRKIFIVIAYEDNMVSADILVVIFSSGTEGEVLTMKLQQAVRF